MTEVSNYPGGPDTIVQPENGQTHPNNATPVAQEIARGAAIADYVGYTTDARGDPTITGGQRALKVGQVTRATVASAATLTLPEAGDVVVTGTTTVTAITATGNSGREVVLEVPSGCQLTDNGTTLNLGGANFVGPGRIALLCDGTHWQVVGRSDAAISGAAPPVPKVEVANSGNQTLTTGTPTILTFDTDLTDADGFHSTSSNTSRLVVPAGMDGRYHIYFHVGFVANATGYRMVEIYRNSGGVPQGGDALSGPYILPAISGIDTYVHGAAEAMLAAGDYVEIHATHNRGSNLDVFPIAFGSVPTFGMQRIGA